MGKQKSLKTHSHQEDPRSCRESFGLGVSERDEVLCVLARYKGPWKIVLKGGQGLGSRACWDKGSMCEPFMSSLQPSSGRLEFGDIRGGYPGFTELWEGPLSPWVGVALEVRLWFRGTQRLLSLKASSSGSQACPSPITDRPYWPYRVLRKPGKKVSHILGLGRPFYSSVGCWSF